MMRFGLPLVLILVVAVVSRANDDPEPPKKRASHTATSGDYTVTAVRGGFLMTTNKRGQTLWKLEVRADRNETAQVAIEGEYVVALFEGSVCGVALRTGKMYWQAVNGVPKAALAVKNGKVTIQAGSRKDVIDLQTGKVLERSR